ncbi:unnamed protein product [Rotaria sp. Silwood1]|nr:unnamed protein product [Rotaria sp. Silwood1]CAF1307946.1 unnamed protein product [Rotaria sp. Silwood1]CAF3466778.1 unnamed protein product [Rotaria sp. Silwood1]CAF4689393.1 unnamed protein product [Rotaria sp. Silwood1]
MNNITTPGQVITDLKLSSNKDSGEKKISKKEENVSSTSDITNILLLGETGVGKSTFINAFANYLTFNTLEEAQRNEPVVLMPVSFLMTTGDNFEEHIVKFGDIDDSNNEDFDHPGQSVTQHCKAYVFYLNGTDQQKLRIIDTPGFGDTRGIEQDDLNMEHILEYVNNLSHLNAICFLLKPNASRLNISFRSCITQLFSLLDQNALNNIIFCFTNSRSTFYTPGDTAPLLKKMLISLSIGNVPFKKENIFCFDSESFRYLVAVQNGIKFNGDERQEYEMSWSTSVNQSNRLIGYIRKNIGLYHIDGTLQSMKHVQYEINHMVRPMLKTMRNYLRNLILRTENSIKASLKLHAKDISFPATLCISCVPYALLVGQFWIAKNIPHKIQNNHCSCECSLNQHIPIDYILEYKSSKKPLKPNHDDISDLLHKLCYASAELSYFLVHSTAFSKISNAELDCTIYDNDLDGINLNQFYITRSPAYRITSVVYDSTLKVKEFNVFNDVNPSSSVYCVKSLGKLQLVNTNLTILSDIKNLQNLTSLIIETDNGIIDQHLPSEFGQLKSLSILKLSNITNLEDLPDEIKYLSQLQSLTLEKIRNFNKISDESFGQVNNLNILKLIDLPNLSSIPTTINNLQLLQQLEITNINIHNLQLENLFVLQSIIISSNTKLISLDMINLSSIPTMSIKNNQQLKTIILENFSKLNTFELYSSSNLELISFQDASLLSTIIIISSPTLKTISLINVPSIRNLTLSGCELTIFPESILTLTSLEVLNMKSNQLSTLPLTLLTDLPNLRILNLTNNKFQENIFQPALIYLRELDLSNNSLTSIDNIGKYKSLQILDLNINKISLIPLEIMKLSSTLKRLTMNSNVLNGVPYSMANMRSLEVFSATANNISYYEIRYLIELFNKSPIRASFY